MPRFAPENYAVNLKLFPAFQKLAKEVGATPSQLALAWLLNKSKTIIPIPGTTSLSHLAEDLDAADLRLSPQVMAALEALINQNTVLGSRYNALANSEVDTEVF
jgi:aryl-alcohol dehydrogenase-like predicted oxidoreductase